MVWSPMSNLLLYGATSRVKSARESGVRVRLGRLGQQEPAPISSSSTARPTIRIARWVGALEMVMINGVSRFGTSALMSKLGVTTQGERMTSRRPPTHGLPRSALG
jgi:hypothetical protein